MSRFVCLALFVACVALSSAAVHEKNCTTNRDGRTLSCYSCMGRDLENCMYGLSCCKGSCYKLIDQEHKLIVKGCTNDNEEDKSMKVRELPIDLYWSNNEKVKGESYFCKGNEYCNGVSATALLSLPLALLARLF